MKEFNKVSPLSSIVIKMEPSKSSPFVHNFFSSFLIFKSAPFIANHLLGTIIPARCSLRSVSTFFFLLQRYRMRKRHFHQEFLIGKRYLIDAMLAPVSWIPSAKNSKSPTFPGRRTFVEETAMKTEERTGKNWGILIVRGSRVRILTSPPTSPIRASAIQWNRRYVGKRTSRVDTTIRNPNSQASRIIASFSMKPKFRPRRTLPSAKPSASPPNQLSWSQSGHCSIPLPSRASRFSFVSVVSCRSRFSTRTLAQCLSLFVTESLQVGLRAVLGRCGETGLVFRSETRQTIISLSSKRST